MLPLGYTLLEDYYSTKKLIKDLGLPVEKIGVRKNECMLYWKNGVDLEYCNFVGMLGTSQPEGGTHVGRSPHMLSLDGQYGRTYSCWPVIITPYNFPLGMCMSSEYMFLTMVIPGSSNPKRLIDVYLEPLIEELL
ncbi:UNVERIFIED_CONTAM: hypothetical protein Sradi_2048600 [Sesamum radiatum]|uniref:Uncharacterized protein n=1 Tax=Sesamum radiatum TaxID=300843 RepID=A0AAW2THS5_SESRA